MSSEVTSLGSTELGKKLQQLVTILKEKALPDIQARIEHQTKVAEALVKAYKAKQGSKEVDNGKS